jgi:hypothetical protein
MDWAAAGRRGWAVEDRMVSAVRSVRQPSSELLWLLLSLLQSEQQIGMLVPRERLDAQASRGF